MRIFFRTFKTSKEKKGIMKLTKTRSVPAHE